MNHQTNGTDTPHTTPSHSRFCHDAGGDYHLSDVIDALAALCGILQGETGSARAEDLGPVKREELARLLAVIGHKAEAALDAYEAERRAA